jgi:glycosyltransferase involved in cell wall biosynthesis
MTTRVLHVITGLDTGGAERMLEKIVTCDARTCTDSVVSLMDLGPIGRRLVSEGVEVHALGMAPGKFSLGGLYRLVRILRRMKPDVVQGWLYHGNLAASAAVFLAGLRNVAVHWGIRGTFYGMDLEKRGTRIVINLLARLSTRPDSIHYNSRRSRQQHEQIGFDGTRAVIIPNGFDVEGYRRDEAASRAAREKLGIAPGTLVIGMVTRDHPMKDHQTFLDAAFRFVKGGGDAVFVLAGRGIDDGNEKLRSAIDSLNLRSRTHLLGELADPCVAYRLMDVLSLTSAWGEAFPNVLGEAMSFEIPCVTTDIGDSAEIVGESGFVVSIRDSAAVARAFEELQSMGVDGRRRLGSIARARVLKNFALREICQRFNDLHEFQQVDKVCAES